MPRLIGLKAGDRFRIPASESGVTGEVLRAPDRNGFGGRVTLTGPHPETGEPTSVTVKVGPFNEYRTISGDLDVTVIA